MTLWFSVYKRNRGCGSTYLLLLTPDENETSVQFTPNLSIKKSKVFAYNNNKKFTQIKFFNTKIRAVIRKSLYAIWFGMIIAQEN